jgi:ribosomal protein L37E
MNSATTTEPGSSQSLRLQVAPSPLFSSLIQDATLEFHASLQLLAERVRFLTGANGVAVAVQEDDEFVYCASCGISASEIGSVAEVNKEHIRQSLGTFQAVASSSATTEDNGPNFSLVVPLIRTGEIAGFFELVSSRTAFEEQDIRAVNRLADLASTVLELRDGAEQAEIRMFELKQAQAPKPVTPVLWHAPARVETSEASPSAIPSLAIDKIHACSSCGFPVSDGRNLCVECERNPASAVPQTEMFSLGKQENWISAHGYTVASLLVTALVAAIIYWLR